MTFANIDDLFPDHPKVLAAGGDAAWLYVCGLCFTNRAVTGGLVPKAMVGRLSDRKSPDRLARKLVDVGLWEDDGDAYRIHDWGDWNESADAVKARKEQARKAAQARWRKSGRPNAGSNADGIPEASDEQSGSDATSNTGSNTDDHARPMLTRERPRNPHSSPVVNKSVPEGSPVTPARDPLGNRLMDGDAELEDFLARSASEDR